MAVGVTLIGCGAGGITQGWPFASSAVGVGLGFLLSGVFRWRGERS